MEKIQHGLLLQINHTIQTATGGRPKTSSAKPRYLHLPAPPYVAPFHLRLNLLYASALPAVNFVLNRPGNISAASNSGFSGFSKILSF
jgi:hypothetical protein